MSEETDHGYIKKIRQKGLFPQTALDYVRSEHKWGLTATRPHLTELQKHHLMNILYSLFPDLQITTKAIQSH